MLLLLGRDGLLFAAADAHLIRLDFINNKAAAFLRVEGGGHVAAELWVAPHQNAALLHSVDIVGADGSAEEHIFGLVGQRNGDHVEAKDGDVIVDIVGDGGDADAHVGPRAVLTKRKELRLCERLWLVVVGAVLRHFLDLFVGGYV